MPQALREREAQQQLSSEQMTALHARLQESQDEIDQLRLQLQSSVHETMEKTLQLSKLRTRYKKAMHGLKGVQDALCSQLIGTRISRPV